MRRSSAGLLAALVGLALACESPPAAEAEPWVWDLPPGIPPPAVPADNPMSAAKVELGRRLFYDVRLSHDGSMACAGCHDPARAFTDGEATPRGSTGAPLVRNSQSLINVAYYGVYTWANPILGDLEAQALVPLFADAPIELGAQLDTAAILERLAADEALREGFAAAFPDEADPVTVAGVIRALAAFERSLIAFDTPYDRHLRGDPEALGEAARRGLALFESSRVGCARCHPPPFFTTNARVAGEAPRAGEFHNTGLYDLEGVGGYPAGNAGLYEVTGDPADGGKFRVPSLRGVGLTAPYMHDGSVATLEEVVAIYAAGGRVINDGPFAGDGRANPNKSPRIAPIALAPEERADLVAFLLALDDPGPQGDPEVGPP